MTWVWWTVLGVVVFALVLLALVFVAVLRRAGPLVRAIRRAQSRAADAERLRPRLESLQERAESVQLAVARAQERAAQMRS